MEAMLKLLVTAVLCSASWLCYIAPRVEQAVVCFRLPASHPAIALQQREACGAGPDLAVPRLRLAGVIGDGLGGARERDAGEVWFPALLLLPSAGPVRPGTVRSPSEEETDVRLLIAVF